MIGLGASWDLGQLFVPKHVVSMAQTMMICAYVYIYMHIYIYIYAQQYIALLEWSKKISWLSETYWKYEHLWTKGNSVPDWSWFRCVPMRLVPESDKKNPFGSLIKLKDFHIFHSFWDLLSMVTSQSRGQVSSKHPITGAAAVAFHQDQWNEPGPGWSGWAASSQWDGNGC